MHEPVQRWHREAGAPMTLRRMIFWLHLVCGVTVGLVIAFLATTGSILTFQPQVVAWAERDMQIAAPPAGPCVAPSTLLTHAAAYAHAMPTGLTLYADPHRPAEIAFGQDGVVLAAACDGHVIGKGAAKLRGFFQSVRDLHRWIAWDGVRHETLRHIKNACVLVFVLLIVSGLVLWVPRRVAWQHLRPALWFRGGLRGRAREWNWHNVFGLWMSLPLLTIALTGVIMAYGWANALLFRAAGTPAPGEHREGNDRRAVPLAVEKYGSLDAAIARAEQQDAAWKILTLRLPAEKEPDVSFTVDKADGGHPQARAQLVIARRDGRVVHWEPFSSTPRGRQWRAYVRFLHTGEIFGTAGRATALLAALSALMLVWTGFSQAVRRWLAWRRQGGTRIAARRRQNEPAASETIEV
ncbi:MAG TPA: PepSY-associated TM helix domain-containing protein [Terracidiphilus sp.]|nr:PepSY-associated TM helix domain-containing protein [Terracidiphilus sp.]